MKTPTLHSFKKLLLHNTGETDFLDFKVKWIDLTKLAKHTLAIANSGGGCIVVGVGQSDDGSALIDGLDNQDFLDKADIDNKLEHYLPKWLRYRTEDFIFGADEKEPLKGKKFQVLMIEYDPKYIPYTSVVTKGELRFGAIYIRQGTKSIEATNEKLVEIILRKVESGGSFASDLSIQDHLQQLKTLYEELNKAENKGYREFLNKSIKYKEKRIINLLDIQDEEEQD